MPMEALMHRPDLHRTLSVEGELTGHFTEAATVLCGCHVTGHDDAGMVGTITVAGS